MENEKIKTKNQVEEDSSDEINKKFFIGTGIFVLGLAWCISVCIFSSPLVAENLYCNYSSKFNKITCTQTGDIVPQWLQLDDNNLQFLGISNAYEMKLIISHDNKNYRVLNMTDKEFITDRNRKFIYELKEQTFMDWINFKKYFSEAKTSNWGSVILYCSENNLKDNICKNMKKWYKSR